MTTKTTHSTLETKKSHLKTNDLYSIADIACEHIDVILDSLGLDYNNVGKLYYCECPIHQGGNKSALNLYINESMMGKTCYWKCNTHSCQKNVPNKPSIFTFVQLALGAIHGKTVSFLEAKKYILATLGIDKNAITEYKVDRDKSNFISAVNGFKHVKNMGVEKFITKEYWMKNLIIPSPYYLSRGYSPRVLIKHMVGESTKGYTSGRVLVPILHNDSKIIIGWTARAIEGKAEPKWLHSKGLSTHNCLYNYWNAEKHVQESNHLIIVEGPGDVWKLEQAGLFNSVAIFGNNISDQQLWLLHSLPIMKLTILTDNDQGGDTAEANIRQHCERLYKINRVRPADGYKDVGDMPVEKVLELPIK